ncbi:MAG: ankyrin repeat domain-containing protein [Phycisphaerales bacterium]|nr:ankyrin repeat domain-containing protein [Phycisphaerales bacterium]
MTTNMDITTKNTTLTVESKVNRADDVRGLTLLHRAAHIGNPKLINALLDIGATIDASDVRSDSTTPLHVAALHDNVEAINALLDRGASIESPNAHGHTPLHVAALHDSLEAVKALLDRGSNIEAADNRGNTPLHDAARRGRTELVTLLLKKGANVNATNACSETPLHLAAQDHGAVGSDQGNVAAIRVLLENGADLTRRNNLNRTAEQTARLNGSDSQNRSVIEVLREAAARNQWGGVRTR